MTMTLAQFAWKLGELAREGAGRPEGIHVDPSAFLVWADAIDAHLSQPHPVAQGEAVATREIAFGWRPLMSWALGTIDELNEGPMTADQWGEDAGLYQSARGLLEATPTIPTGHRVVPVEPVEAVAEVRHFNYSGIARNGFSQEAVLLDGTPIFPEGTKLYVAPAKTDGFVDVPSDPTNKMLEASAVKWTHLCHGYAPASGHDYFMRELWQAMLAAAPDAGGV